MPSSKWLGADFSTTDGLTHYPNLPTEEAFTTPDPERVDGHVSATMPLELYGSFMNGIRIEFEGGRAVKIDADEGADALRAPSRGTPARRGSARSHSSTRRAGSAPSAPSSTRRCWTRTPPATSRSGTPTRSRVEDEADRKRVNKSDIHVDFMIGRNEVDVDGVTRDGDRVPVLRGGAWQILPVTPRRGRAHRDPLVLGAPQAVLPTATECSRSRISAADSPRSSSRGSAATLSSPKTRSKSGVVR